jgi:hypothetical protein
MEQPCASAISRQGLRSAEWSQPQPRSNGPPPSTVHARPPRRGRASRRRQSTPPSWSRRAAAIPAAPPPMTTTSASSLVISDSELDPSRCHSELAIPVGIVEQRRARSACSLVSDERTRRARRQRPGALKAVIPGDGVHRVALAALQGYRTRQTLRSRASETHVNAMKSPVGKQFGTGAREGHSPTLEYVAAVGETERLLHALLVE